MYKRQAPYPGDNGDWTSWDEYLTHVVKDMRKNSMLESIVIDIWNEPDLVYKGVAIFWNRSQEQYLQMVSSLCGMIETRVAANEL